MTVVVHANSVPSRADCKHRINWILVLVLGAWIASRTAAETLAFLSNHLDRLLTEYGVEERDGVEIWVIPG